MSRPLVCPVCNRPFDGSAIASRDVERDTPAPVPPFCSARCKLVDLSRWLGEEYTISSTAGADGGDTWDLDGLDLDTH